MDKWADLIKKHAIHQQIDEAQGLIDLLGDVPPEHDGQMRHLREVLVHLELRLESADPHLVSPTHLDSLSTRLAELTGLLDQYAADHSQPQYIEQALGPGARIMATAAAIPSAAPEKNSQVALESAKRLRTEATAGIRAARRAGKTLEKDFDETKRHLDSTQAEANEKLSSVANAVDELDKTIQQQAGRLDTALADFEARTVTALEEMQTHVLNSESARADEARKSAKAQLDALEEAGTTATEEFERKGGAVIARLEDLLGQAEKLVGTITSTGTAGYYKKVADGERSAANNWRIITVVTACVVGVIGLWAVLSARGNASSDWEGLLAKALLSAPFAAIAAYAGRQSGSHRTAERDARHRELQLAALEPFLDPLQDEDKAAVRAGFAQHLFGPGGLPVPEDGADAISTSELLRLVSALALQSANRRD